MNWNPHLGNILTVYAHSDRWDREQGLAAYRGYNSLLGGLAQEYGTSVTKAVGVFAALSPNADYKTNLESTHRVLRAHAEGKELDEFKVTTYGNNKRKAWRIMEGEDPLTLLVAKKTRSFYLNMIDPSDTAPVTVDGHMFSVWHLKRFNMQDAKVGSGGRYDKIAQDYRTAAKAVGLIPNQLQATCWFAWKRLNLISVDRESLQLPLITQ